MDDKIELPCEFKLSHTIVRLYEQKLFNAGALTVPPKHHRLTCLRGGDIVLPTKPKNGKVHSIKYGNFMGSKRIITISNIEGAFIKAIAHRVVAETVHWYLTVDKFLNDTFIVFLKTGKFSDFPYERAVHTYLNNEVKSKYIRPLDDDQWNVFDRIGMIQYAIDRWHNAVDCKISDRYTVDLLLIKRQCDAIVNKRRLAVPFFKELGDCLYSPKKCNLHAVSYIDLVTKTCSNLYTRELFNSVYEHTHELNKIKEEFINKFTPESIDLHIRWLSPLYNIEAIQSAREYFMNNRIINIMGQQISYFIMSILARIMFFIAMTGDGRTSSSLLFNLFTDSIAVITGSFDVNTVVLREDLRILYKSIK